MLNATIIVILTQKITKRKISENNILIKNLF